MTAILQTLHGSRLYGTHHAQSDYDTFVVAGLTGRTRQKILGADDAIRMSLDGFLDNVFRGSAQSCEALFSPVAIIDPHYAAMFAGIRVTGSDAFQRYRRTIDAHTRGTLKQRRHAVRLGLNFAELRTTGRFNPQLDDAQKRKVRDIADRHAGAELYDIASNF